MVSGFKNYDPGTGFDELIDPDGEARPHAAALVRYFDRMTSDQLVDRQRAVDRTIADMGISFTVYSEGDNIDRSWPLDLIPRAMPASEWDRIEAGLVQRVQALNLFIDDLYNKRRTARSKAWRRSSTRI